MVYSDVITNLVSEGVFLFWWTGLILSDWSFADSGDFTLALSETWGVLFWPLNILFVALFVLHIWVLLKGFWARWASVTELVLCAAFLAALVRLAGNQPLLAVPLEHGVGQWFERTLLLVLGGIAVATVWDGVLAYRRLR